MVSVSASVVDMPRGPLHFQQINPVGEHNRECGRRAVHFSERGEWQKCAVRRMHY
jgi:hypothetical protein